MTKVQTLQDCVTTLPADQVLASAKTFFARRQGIYSAFLDREGPGFATFRGQGGEEIVIGVAAAAGGTRVNGSNYLFDMQVARFFATLPQGEGNAARTGETRGSAAESSATNTEATGVAKVAAPGGSADSETQPKERTRPGTVGNAAGKTATGRAE